MRTVGGEWVEASKTRLYLGWILANLQASVLSYLHKEERDRETKMTYRMTAEIDNGGEIKTVTVKAEANEVSDKKNQVKAKWIRTGGTINWKITEEK
jgi:hypothetical protein